MMKPTYFDAVVDLIGGAINGVVEGPLDTYTFIDGQTPPTEEAIQAKLTELQTDYDAKQYQRDRVYPSIGEQLDLQYWDKKNGTKKWEEAIDKVKADHPKG